MSETVTLYTLGTPEAKNINDFAKALVQEMPFYFSVNDARNGIKEEYQDLVSHMRPVKITIEFVEN